MCIRDRWQVADLTRITRNAIAHQSKRAVDELNTRLREPSTKPAFAWTGQRDLDIAGIRRYLRTPDGAPRVATFHSELDVLALALRVP